MPEPLNTPTNQKPEIHAIEGELARVYTFANGAAIVTNGSLRPNGTIAAAQLPIGFVGAAGASNAVGTLSATGAFFAGTTIVQVGTLTTTNYSGSANIVRLDAAKITMDPTGGVVGSNTWLIYGLSSAGSASGHMAIKAFDLTYAGNIGNSSLTGTVNGLSGQAAASAANISPSAENAYSFNACPITSVNCGLISSSAVSGLSKPSVPTEDLTPTVPPPIPSSAPPTSSPPWTAAPSPPPSS